MSEEKKRPPFSVGFLVLLFCTAVLIGTTIYLISTIFDIPYKIENDFMNWAAVVIEIGVAVFISGIVLLYDRKHKRELRTQQDEIAKLLKRIEDIEINQQKMISEQYSVTKNEKERIEAWKSDWGELILSSLESIRDLYQYLEDWLKDYQKNPSPKLKKNIIETGKKNGDIIKYHSNNIERWIPKIENYFKDPTLGAQIIGFNEQLSALFDSLHMEYHWESNFKTTFSAIDERKATLSNFIESLKKELPSAK